MKKIRVLIAEDSDAMRSTLETLFALDPRIEVIGSARDGFEVVTLAKSLKPDLVTMDVVMPRLDGVEATARIMAEHPVRILIISAYADNVQIDLSFRAMAAGALEVVTKPVTSTPGALRAWAQKVCDTIVLMAEVPVITRARRGSFSERRADVVGIVASTGGPLALAHIFAALPSSLPVPIVVAQHIAEGFTEGLIRWLSNVSKLTVEVALEGVTPRPGHVYFPPDQRDLEVGSDRTLRTPKANDRYAPSGDRLLGSLAHAYANRCAGIVLTGMGEDGAAGLLAIRQAGGATLAQSRDSCVVFGMPQAAMTRGATTDMRSLDGLAAAIVELAGPPRRMPTVTGH
jgi:two-component system chemotaxis response regulator CheB